jgi:hypothetical protein
MRAVGHRTAAAVIERAQQLLWVVARCDVENLISQRRIAMAALVALEAEAIQIGIGDLYQEIARCIG